MALKYSANKLQLLVPTAKRHTQAKFTQDNISVRPSNVDKVVKAIYEDLEDISASLGVTQSFVSLTDTPSEYTDVGNMLIGVKSTEDGMEFKDWAISASTLYPSGTSGDLGKEGNAIQKVFFGNSGNIDYQQDLSILSAGVQKAVFKQTTGYLGLGVNNPLEPIHSSNGIVIGNAVQSTPGTIRYFEGDFKGYDGEDWKSFTILPEGYFNTLVNDSDDITEGSTNLFLTSNEQTKLSNISITQPVDLDTLESDVTTNNAKVSNANHSGDISGSTTLTAQPELITNKTSVSATALDSLLISDQSDSNNLKKITIQSILNLTPTPNWGNIGGTLSLQTDLQNALNAKENSITAGTTGQYYRGDKTFQTLDKTTVGLDNVDNTSDANKPISTATQTALDLITDINWLGDYNNGYTYAVGDGVMFNGASFRMIAAIGAAGYTPSAYPANWLQITEYYNIIQDTTPQLGGNLDLNGNDINGTGNVDVTGNVIADVVQLRGGTGTQGEISWSADEETIKLIMDGTTLYMGQDTFVHVRNNTASIITKGTAVYATGTLGASGRITVAPMIANGTIAGRLFIGLAAEDIAIGADGQVCSYGKIRGINTNTYTDGDVLWISPTVAGQLTTTEPTAPNLKIATAFVIHAATNGILMVRAEQGTDLHSDQRVQVSGLANNDVLTWNNVNQRWQNAQPEGGGHEIYNGTDVTPLPERAGLRFTGYLEAVDDAGNDETIVDLSSTAITPTETTRFAENGSGNIDLKIQENKLLKGNAGGFAIELSFAQEGILGLDVNNEVKEFETVEIYNILRENAVTGNKQLALLDINGNSANVKAKFEISAIAVENTTANAVTISIGTTAGATNVANAVVIGANALVKLPLGTTFFSTTSGQNLFISSGSWNSANINIHVTISKIWQ